MSTPPAGWYPDPAMAHTQRYWDGTQWTGNVAPLVAAPAPVAPAPADHGPGSAEHWLLPVGRSGVSIAAGYVGIVALLLGWMGWFGLVIGSVSLGLGIWALVKARSGGHGRGRAIFAIVAGVLAIGFGTLAAILLF